MVFSGWIVAFCAVQGNAYDNYGLHFSARRVSEEVR